MMTYWLLTRTGNDVEAPSNMAATTASETSAEEPGEVKSGYGWMSLDGYDIACKAGGRGWGAHG